MYVQNVCSGSGYRQKIRQNSFRFWLKTWPSAWMSTACCCRLLLLAGCWLLVGGGTINFCNFFSTNFSSFCDYFDFSHMLFFNLESCWNKKETIYFILMLYGILNMSKKYFAWFLSFYWIIIRKKRGCPSLNIQVGVIIRLLTHYCLFRTHVFVERASIYCDQITPVRWGYSDE